MRFCCAKANALIGSSAREDVRLNEGCNRRYSLSGFSHRIHFAEVVDAIDLFENDSEGMVRSVMVIAKLWTRQR